MMALAVDDGLDRRAAPTLGWDGVRLVGALAASAARDADGLAFGPQPGRARWSGRPDAALSFGEAHALVRRLALTLVSLGLPKGATVCVCLPNSPEACLAILALESAGLTPCLLPAAWTEDDLALAVESVNAAAIITQTRIGPVRLAETFCRIAARYFGVRFICAFGPDVPDGVIDLDPSLAAEGADADFPTIEGKAGVITFARQNGGLRPDYRTRRASVAAAVTFLVSAGYEPGDRIVSLLAPDDHRSLTTTFLAALLSGASLECHELFDGVTLRASLARNEPTHLVAPGWMEQHLTGDALPGSLRSLILVHEAPTRFKARGNFACHVVDVLGFDEMALVAKGRDQNGYFKLALDDDGIPAAAAAHGLLHLRRDEEGRIFFKGAAADTRDFTRGSVGPAPSGWRDSGYRADLFAGMLIGVARAGT
jgi:hypothetical protein